MAQNQEKKCFFYIMFQLWCQQCVRVGVCTTTGFDVWEHSTSPCLRNTSAPVAITRFMTRNEKESGRGIVRRDQFDGYNKFFCKSRGFQTDLRHTSCKKSSGSVQGFSAKKSIFLSGVLRKIVLSAFLVYIDINCEIQSLMPK